MTDTVLSMTDVDKSFRRKKVLDSCTLEIERGSVTALVGSNGAGKSTLMSLVVGLLSPDRGSVSVLGNQVGHGGIASGLSYLPQHKPLYPHFSVREMLHFGRNTNSQWNNEYASQLIDAAGVSLTSRVKSLSPGHRTRVALALALGRRPEVLLLDEPLADLDPVARRAVAQTLMRDAAEHGTTIVMSSHVLSELEDVADTLMLLRDGRIRLSGSLDTVTEEHYLLTGGGDPVSVVGEGSVVSEVLGSGGAVFVVRGPRPQRVPGWSIDNAILDDVVLAHLSAEAVS